MKQVTSDIEQRSQTGHHTARWVLWGLVGSIVLHSGLLLTIRWPTRSTTPEPEELAIVIIDSPSEVNTILPKVAITPPQGSSFSPNMPPIALAEAPSSASSTVTSSSGDRPLPATDPLPAPTASPASQTLQPVARPMPPVILSATSPSPSPRWDGDATDNRRAAAPATSASTTASVARGLTGTLDHSAARQGQTLATGQQVGSLASSGAGSTVTGSLSESSTSVGTTPRPVVVTTSSPPATDSRRQRPACIFCPQPPVVREGNRTVEGSTGITFDIAPDGRPINIRLRTSSGNVALDRATLETVQQWRFAPSEQGYVGARQRVNFVEQDSQFHREVQERQQRNAQQRSTTPLQPVPTQSERSALPSPSSPSSPIATPTPAVRLSVPPVPESTIVAPTPAEPPAAIVPPPDASAPPPVVPPDLSPATPVTIPASTSTPEAASTPPTDLP